MRLGGSKHLGRATLRLASFLGALLLLAAAAQADDPEIIAYWNFNQTTSGQWTLPINASTGSGTVTSNFVATNVVSFGGTTINAQSGSPAGGSLSLQPGTSLVNNGRHFDITVSTEGFESIVVSAAVQRTNTGFNNNSVSYSVDGGAFTSVGVTNTPFDPPTGFALREWTLPAAAADKETLVVRFTLDGGSNATGNNRYDNLLVTGVPSASGPTDPALAVALDPIDFGTSAPSEIVTRNLAITNNGATQNLTVLATTTISGPDAARFGIVSPPRPFNIAPGATTNLVLDFDSDGGTGSFEATLELRTNDPTNPLREIPLVAEAVATFPPDAVDKLGATPGVGRVDLSWRLPLGGDGPTSMRVYRGTTPGFAPGAPLATLSATARTYVDTAVVDGTAYYYIVRAANIGGESPDSNEALAVPGGFDPDSAPPVFGYYGGLTDADFASPSALRGALSALLADNVGDRISYTNSRPFIEAAHEDPADPDNVIDFYTGLSVPKADFGGGGGDGPDTGNWSREHLWPQSSFDQAEPARGDLHALTPTDQDVNNARSNFPFGVVLFPTYDSGYGSVGVSGRFEPRDAVKGEAARAMLYMDTRYAGSGGEPNLVLNNSPSTATGAGQSGILSDLLAWHASDPPTREELFRNDLLQGAQANRNPFVDYSWMAGFIHGLTTAIPPAPPASVTVAADGADVVVEWEAASGALSYEIWRRDSTAPDWPAAPHGTASTTTFSDAGAAAGEWDYAVVAVNANGASPTSAVASFAAALALLYEEDFGTPSSNTNLDAYTGFQTPGVVWSSGGAPAIGDVRNTGVSSGYPGASGTGNLFMGTAGGDPLRGAAVTGIDATGHTGLRYEVAINRTGGTLPGNVFFYYTVDNGTTWVPVDIEALLPTTGGWPSAKTTITLPPSVGDTDQLGFKWEKAAGTGASFRLDDIAVRGVESVGPPPEDPTLLAAPASLDFGPVEVGEASVLSFTASGSNLDGAVSIDAAGPFGLSTSAGGPFAGSLTLDPVGGEVSATTIFVQFAPTAEGASSGSATLSSTGADDVVVALAGEGFVPVPGPFTLTDPAGLVCYDFDDFRGAEGDLDAGAFALAGNLLRGASTGGVSAGGFWAFEVEPGNYALGVQPTSSFFSNESNGSIVVTVENRTGGMLVGLDVSYRVWIYNDQDRANAFDVAWSRDGGPFTPVPLLAVESPEPADPSPGWGSIQRRMRLTGLVLPDGGDILLRFTGADISGGGARDEFALDDLCVQPAGERFEIPVSASTTSEVGQEGVARAQFAGVDTGGILGIESYTGNAALVPGSIDRVWRIDPSGLGLAPGPHVVTLFYEEAQLPAGFIPSNLRVFKTGTNPAVPLANAAFDTEVQPIDLDTESRKITFDVDGFSYFVATQDDDGPLLIALDAFSAYAPAPGQPVMVRWTTSSEVDNAGFHVWASPRKGPFAELERRVNASLIAPEGSEFAAAEYELLDPAPLGADEERWYWLEDIDFSGVSTFHGPVQALLGEPAASSVGDWTVLE